jgi:cold shock CspA family protein
MDDRMSGKVAWYRQANGYGVIQGADGKEYFFHRTNLKDDLLTPTPGAGVTFVGRPRKYKPGLKAFAVETVLARATWMTACPQSLTPTPQVRASAAPSEPISAVSPQSTSGGFWYSRAKAVPAESSNLCTPGQAIETSVVGTIYEGRQAVVAQLCEDEQVWLKREPDNPHDRNAVQVLRQNGRKFGYINRLLAAALAPHLDAYGLPVPATVTALSGGVRIRFTVPQTED